MNDETYEKLKEVGVQPQDDNYLYENKAEMYAENPIEHLFAIVERHRALLDLCLEAVERFGANHQASYKGFVKEFNRIKDKPL